MTLADAVSEHPPITASRPYQDCLSCRIVGTGTLAGVGSYALWQSRPAAPGGPWQKRFMAGLGTVFLAGGVVRWFNLQSIRA